MNIGQAAAAGGVSSKMIRHYESIGLLAQAKRSQSGYRQYSANDIHTLRFIKQARNLGFSTDHIRDLLSLWQNHRRSSQRVRDLAKAHLHTVDRRIAELNQIKKTLEHLVHHCQGDERPDCPIIDRLATDPVAVPGENKKSSGQRKNNL